MVKRIRKAEIVKEDSKAIVNFIKADSLSGMGIHEEKKALISLCRGPDSKDEISLSY